jgi:hypothetical protein
VRAACQDACQKRRHCEHRTSRTPLPSPPCSHHDEEKARGRVAERRRRHTPSPYQYYPTGVPIYPVPPITTPTAGDVVRVSFFKDLLRCSQAPSCGGVGGEGDEGALAPFPGGWRQKAQRSRHPATFPPRWRPETRKGWGTRTRFNVPRRLTRLATGTWLCRTSPTSCSRRRRTLMTTTTTTT